MVIVNCVLLWFHVCCFLCVTNDEPMLTMSYMTKPSFCLHLSLANYTLNRRCCVWVVNWFHISKHQWIQTSMETNSKVTNGEVTKVEITSHVRFIQSNGICCSNNALFSLPLYAWMQKQREQRTRKKKSKRHKGGGSEWQIELWITHSSSCVTEVSQ